jgi:UDP-N-acetylglucosamine 2-epimerase
MKLITMAGTRPNSMKIAPNLKKVEASGIDDV